jgi:hypothetical protein
VAALALVSVPASAQASRQFQQTTVEIRLHAKKTTLCLDANVKDCIALGKKVKASVGRHDIPAYFQGIAELILALAALLGVHKASGKDSKGDDAKDEGEAGGGDEGEGLCLNAAPSLSTSHGIEIGKCGGYNSQWYFISQGGITSLALESVYWANKHKTEYITASHYNKAGFIYLDPRLVHTTHMEKVQEWYGAGITGGKG